MKILEIQHFLGLWGLSRAEIFRFEIFHLQLKSAGLRMFSIGLHQISTGGTLTNRVYPIWFRQGYSWVCKGCTLFLANSFLHSFSWFFVPVTRSVLTQDPQFCVPQNCYVSFVPVAHSVLTQDPQFWNAKLLCFLQSCNTFCVNAGPSGLYRKTGIPLTWDLHIL